MVLYVSRILANLPLKIGQCKVTEGNCVCDQSIEDHGQCKFFHLINTYFNFSLLFVFWEFVILMWKYSNFPSMVSLSQTIFFINAISDDLCPKGCISIDGFCKCHEDSCQG